jgi:hypothetical protein
MAEIVETFKDEERPRNLGQFKTPDGTVTTFASAEASDFTLKADAFINEYEQLYRTITDNNRQLYIRYKEVASLHESSFKAFSRLADLMSLTIKNEKAKDICKKLSGLNVELSDRALTIGATCNAYLFKHLEFRALCEPDAFR